jgi:hypothetical protein
METVEQADRAFEETYEKIKRDLDSGLINESEFEDRFEAIIQRHQAAVLYTIAN